MEWVFVRDGVGGQIEQASGENVLWETWRLEQVESIEIWNETNKMKIIEKKNNARHTSAVSSLLTGDTELRWRGKMMNERENNAAQAKCDTYVYGIH